MKKTIISIVGSAVFPSIALACPFCNSGGREATIFMLSFFGSGMLASVSIFFWAMVSGKFKNIERPKYRILELDRTTKIKPENKE